MRIRILFASGWALLGAAAASGSEALDAARATISEWVQVESAISREAAAWRAKNASLRELTDVALAEIAKLEKEIAALEATATAADERRLALVEEREDLSVQTETIRAFLSGMEGELRTLEKSLPAPLQRKLEPFFLRLPENPQRTTLGIAERMQTVVGALSSILKFDESIAVDTEVRTLSDGTRGEVTTLYIGLGAAYYVAPSANEAGYGVFGDVGWQWIPQPELREAIQDAVALAEGRDQEARFIPLPVDLANHE